MPRDDPAERGEPLSVGVAHAAEIERRLIVDADEPARRRAVGAPARHRHGAVLVQEPGVVRALERDRREAFLGPVRIDAGLNHLDLDLVCRAGCPSSRCDGTCRRRSGRASTYFRKFAAVPGALAASTSITMSPSSVWTTTCGMAWRPAAPPATPVSSGEGQQEQRESRQPIPRNRHSVSDFLTRRDTTVENRRATTGTSLPTAAP